MDFGISHVWNPRVFPDYPERRSGRSEHRLKGENTSLSERINQ